MNQLLKLYILIIVTCSSWAIYAEKVKNAHLLQTDSFFSHHVLLVEKSTHRLFLYENNDGTPKLVKIYDVATGKSRGNKSLQGDKKTPEGIYSLSSFLPAKFLEKKYGNYGKIYGVGAFPMNYPNPLDKLEGKTGGGIWLHSTDDDSRISKKLDSRGCVVLKQEDIKDISRFIDISYKTPAVIVEHVNYRDKRTTLEEKSSILSFIISWQQAWKSQQLYPYIAHYASSQYRDRVHGNFKSFTAYKRKVFSKRDQPKIEFSHNSIFVNNDYAMVQMLQNYESQKLKDIGKKTLYLKKDDKYSWKIVAEHWEKVRLPLKKFTPSQRFFLNE